MHYQFYLLKLLKLSLLLCTRYKFFKYPMTNRKYSNTLWLVRKVNLNFFIIFNKICELLFTFLGYTLYLYDQHLKTKRKQEYVIY